jgi:hypothetical protein
MISRLPAEPIIQSFGPTTGGIRRVFIAGVGGSALNIFGAVHPATPITDPATFEFDQRSLAARYPDDPKTFVAYALEHDVVALVNRLGETLTGDCEFIVLSAGAEAFYWLSQRQWPKPRFRIAGVTFVNPATCWDGYQPGQQRAIALCARLKGRPAIYAGRLPQQQWHSWLWTVVWPPNLKERRFADRNGRRDLYDIARAGQRAVPFRQLVTSAAALHWSPAFEYYNRGTFPVRFIGLECDKILRTSRNLAQIRQCYGEDRVSYHLIDGDATSSGTHDSLLTRWPLYHQAFTELGV